MEILVTGGNGFVGRHLVAALQKRGESVRVLALPTEDTSWLEERDIAVHRGDIRRPEALVEPLQGVEGVVHLAAMIGAWRPLQDYRKVNVTGTENLCRAALQAGVRRFVHVSSAMVYRMWGRGPVTEDAPLTPLREPYSVTKAEGDEVVQRLIAEEVLPAVIIRPGIAFGPGDRLNFARIADRLRSGKGVIVGSGRNKVPFVYVTDVVQGFLLALDHERAAGEAYNIANDHLLTQEELLGAIAAEIGVGPPRLHVPYQVLYSIACASERISTLTNYRHQPLITRHGVTLYGADNRISIEKARRHLSFAPRVPLREGIKLASAWYRQHQNLVLAHSRVRDRSHTGAC